MLTKVLGVVCALSLLGCSAYKLEAARAMPPLENLLATRECHYGALVAVPRKVPSSLHHGDQGAMPGNLSLSERNDPSLPSLWHMAPRS